jgi:Glycosyl transferase family 2
MNLDTLVVVAFVLAAIPAALFVVNMFFYRPLPRGSWRQNSFSEDSTLISEPTHDGAHGLSVLIPARNEERNLRATLEAVLANHGCDFEVIVLDDHSTDRTAEIVGQMSADDPRLRLESALPLPAGWCGKQHACHILAQLARRPLVVFMDADVRLAPDALSRLAGFMANSDAGLASGIPRQELGTFSERLLLPLIHFLLLGYLPMPIMRWTRLTGFSAGCGQLFIARREAYERCGGHARLRDSLHDGLKLPRVFRRAGFRTDLFDATDVATCRMYRTNAETWRGLDKNAVEGLASPGTILPMTLLLFGGPVLPFVLLAFAPMLSQSEMLWTVAAALLSFAPRALGARLFRQPALSVLLHPLAILALLTIQWHAFAGLLLGRPAIWKGRPYNQTKQIQTIETV